MPTKLKGATVVITGASSGIGRATALRFGDKGANVVLAARNGEVLDNVVREVEQRGGRALAVPTDVTDEGAVFELARRAREAFGPISVWVNDAAVTAFGGFLETPTDHHRRVIETNVMGVIHGARAALTAFEEEGRGVLINLSSVVTRMPQPYATSYVASKHAIRGLSMSLRQELLLEGKKDTHVVTILPAVIDTPLFEHSANFSGRKVRAMPPVYSPEDVADTIVQAAQHPKREVYVGTVGPMANMQMKLMPAAVERVAARVTDKGQFERTPTAPSSGNLFAPEGPEAVSGGWDTVKGPPLGRIAGLSALALAAGAYARRVMRSAH